MFFSLISYVCYLTVKTILNSTIDYALQYFHKLCYVFLDFEKLIDYALIKRIDAACTYVNVIV